MNHKRGMNGKDDDDGENINDDDGEIGKSLSFIKCKPSLVKSNNTNSMNDRSVSPLNRALNSKNMVSSQRNLGTLS